MTRAKSLSTNQLKFEAISRDFRTDTITIPTDAMFDEMKLATRGDDVYSEDPDTISFQERVAELAGFEAGLFCVSGTLSNQLALRTHLTQPPHSVVLDARSHVHNYEAGGLAIHSQAVEMSVTPSNGHHLTLEDIEDFIVRGEEIHGAATRVVSLENTLSGMVFPQDEIVRISNQMRSEGVKMHCDGARMWEVQAKTGTSLKELCAPFDSMSLCMSKGLGAPIGSVLCGTKAFIQRAIWFRKQFGGGVRQSGSLAVAASYALTHHLPLLPGTHVLATKLAVALAHLGMRILLPVETNMVWVDPQPLGFDLATLAERAKASGLRLGASRIVIHFQTRPDAIDQLIDVVSELKAEYSAKAELLPEVVNRSVMFAAGEWDKATGVPVPRTKRMGTYALK